MASAFRAAAGGKAGGVVSYNQKQIMLGLFGALVVAIGVWWWFDTFEKRWEPQFHASDAARDNPMLAATRFLQRRGYTVEVADTLDQVVHKPMARGVVILADNRGIILHDQVSKLMSWVGKGNLLIARPALNFNESKADKSAFTPKEDGETDPFGKRYGVSLRCVCEKHKPRPDPSDENAGKDKTQAPEISNIAFPGIDYPLDIDDGDLYMLPTRSTEGPALQDPAGELVRVYPEGAGHVALLAQNLFNNANFGRHDHAELLLSLIQWEQRGDRSVNHVYIVKDLEAANWFDILRTRFPFGLLALAATLILLFWASVRRFGPLLPEPSDERRALIEHIDASGRWLWKVPGGRDLLLRAARASTDKLLQRRAPELQRMTAEEQVKRLAEHCNLPRAELADAMQGPASKIPIVFTRQIRLLRQVRKSYER